MEKRILYDTFNARYLTFEEIAESFIDNKQFDELIKNNHSLLMGPRGSGKTTMLKMLTPLALKSWKGGAKAKKIRDNIPFYGIYIPTDVQWKKEIEQIEKEFSSSEQFAELISREVVNLNVLSSLCKTFSDLLKLNLSEEDGLVKEIELSKELINIWKLERPISPNLDSIQQALVLRISNINRLTNRARYLKTLHNIEYPNYFHSGYLDQANIACVAFENILKSHTSFFNKPFRWALCFDELEIAPKWLQTELLGYLRSREQKFIFKLTTSPLISLNQEVTKIEAQLDNDYKIIRIWVCNNKEMNEWNKFCEKLINARVRRKLEDYSPNQILGSSDERKALRYDPKFKNVNYRLTDREEFSFLWYLFKSLAEIDGGFRKYLIDKKINPLNPRIDDPDLADQVSRKVKQIALFRYVFLKESGRRSRKVIPLYYGIPFLYEISDGIPRAIIGLIDELLSKIKRNEKGIYEEIRINSQSSITKEVSSRFLKVISTHPEANIKLLNSNNYYNLGDLLTKIGEFFHNKLINSEFSADPINTFTIDAKVNPKVVQLLQLGLHLGAIVHLDPTEGITDYGLINKKFRLSYLLTPHFDLPKREYNTVKLSSILKVQNSDLQGMLFD